MLDKLLSGSAAWFGVPAVVGSALFLLRMVMMGVGGHHGIELHAHDVPDAGHGDAHGGDQHDNPALAFKVLSIQTITAFAMGFGWAGLAALHGFHQSLVTSGLAAAVGGVAMVWVLMLLLKAVSDLQSSGNVTMADTLGCEGDVYATVPAKGQGAGQVRIVVSERQRIFNATSDSDAAPTASKVRVVKVNDDNSLTVTPI
jgi:hypothetical protein